MFSPRKIIRNTRVIMMAISLGVPGLASSAEIVWNPVQDAAGYTTMKPGINMDALIDEVVLLKSTLRQDEKQLSRKVEKRRVTDNETLLSIFLPGGFLYAAYKENAHNQAVREHKLIATQVKEISEDIIALTRIDGPIVLAKH